MSLRLILFIIAALVIAWIFWDHNRKSKKKNYYTNKKYRDSFLVTSSAAPKDIMESNDDSDFASDLERDIEKELGANKSSDFTSADETEQIHIHEADTVEDSFHIEEPSDADWDFATKGDAFDSDDFDPNNVKPDGFKSEDFEPETFDSKLDAGFEPDFEPGFTTPRGSDINKITISDEGDIKSNSENETVRPNLSNTQYQDNYKDTLKEINIDGKSNTLDKVFTIYIKSKDHTGMRGDDLLQGLLSVGCRFGEMSIFHRYEKASGQGEIMFSIASMVKPGTFDLDNMHEFNTPGIALFFTCPGDYSPLIVFDLMLKTSYKLAKYLDADILDDNKELLTAERSAALREKIEYIESGEFFN